MKLDFVLGTRPEILKLAGVILQARSRGHACRIIHTGQHYDHSMSAVFFEELGLPEPDVFLEVGSGTQATQTGAAAARVEEILARTPPDAVIVLGDTNSTLAGALAASKLGIPVVHLEAGARSFDWRMPEEINRRLVDSISTVCCAPTERARRNLAAEGCADRSYLVGDTLSDVALRWAQAARARGQVARQELGISQGAYALATIHRSENADDAARMSEIVSALSELPTPVLVPLHPRSRARLDSFGLLASLEAGCRVLTPMPYLTFLGLLQGACLVLTDSGGVQEEAAIFGIPCLTLRNNTEWLETIESGANVLVGASRERIVSSARLMLASRAGRSAPPTPFQPGSANIVALLERLQQEGRLSIQSADFLATGIPPLP